MSRNPIKEAVEGMGSGLAGLQGKGALPNEIGYTWERQPLQGSPLSKHQKHMLISKVTKLITQKQNLNPGLATEDQPFNDSALLHQKNVIALLHSFHFLFSLLPLAVDKRNFHILKYGEVIPAYI